MKDYIVLIVVAVIIVLAVLYIYKSKKKGKKCIGCPYADKCGKDNKSSYCGSCYHPDNESQKDK